MTGIPPAADDPWQVVDEILAGDVGAGPETQWLFDQTVATSVPRRGILSALHVEDGSTVVDLGCGFGILALELAGLHRIHAIAVDSDTAVLSSARRAVAAAEGRDGLARGSAVRVVAGDAYRLPILDSTVDMVVARYLFQHLGRPEAALREIGRVLRPSGTVCVMDVDDGLYVTHPERSGPYARLREALAAAQVSDGGDRRIGRRLAGLLDAAGFVVAALTAVPQATYGPVRAEGPAGRILLGRLRTMRERIIAGGHMTAADFDADLEALAGAAPVVACEISAHAVVIGVKPAGPGDGGTNPTIP